MFWTENGDLSFVENTQENLAVENNASFQENNANFEGNNANFEGNNASFEGNNANFQQINANQNDFSYLNLLQNEEEVSKLYRKIAFRILFYLSFK